MLPCRIATCAVAAIALSLTTAEAQQARKAFRTEFGPNEREELRADQLILSGVTYAGADDTSGLAATAVQDDALQNGRAHQGGTLSLLFVRRRPRLAVTMSGAAAVRYYHSLNRIGTQRHSTSTSVEWSTSPRLTFSFGHSVAYSPSYSLSLQGPPDIAAAPASEEPSLDYDLSKSKQFQSGAFAGMKYVLSASREITAGYSLSYTNFVGSAQSDFGMQQAAARFRQRLNRSLSLNLGYGEGSGTGTGLTESRRQILDLGLSFDRAFAISPRTMFGVTSGSALLNVDGARRLEMVGSANIRRRLSPRWIATLAYDRSMTAVEGIRHPFAANTVYGEVSGFLGSRTSVSVRPAYTSATSVADSSQNIRHVTGVARAQTALGRHWAAYAEYVMYHHRSSDIPGLRPAFAADTSRHGLRTGLALWSPLR